MLATSAHTIALVRTLGSGNNVMAGVALSRKTLYNIDALQCPFLDVKRRAVFRELKVG